MNYQRGDVVVMAWGQHGERLGVVTKTRASMFRGSFKVLGYNAAPGRWNAHAYYVNPLRAATGVDLVRVRLADRVTFNTKVRHYGGYQLVAPRLADPTPEPA